MGLCTRNQNNNNYKNIQFYKILYCFVEQDENFRIYIISSYETIALQIICEVSLHFRTSIKLIYYNYKYIIIYFNYISCLYIIHNVVFITFKVCHSPQSQKFIVSLSMKKNACFSLISISFYLSSFF